MLLKTNRVYYDEQQGGSNTPPSFYRITTTRRCSTHWHDHVVEQLTSGQADFIYNLLNLFIGVNKYQLPCPAYLNKWLYKAVIDVIDGSDPTVAVELVNKLDDNVKHLSSTNEDELLANYTSTLETFLSPYIGVLFEGETLDLVNVQVDRIETTDVTDKFERARLNRQ